MALDPYIVQNIWEPCAKEFYRRQFHEMILMEKAHGIMLARQGLLEAEDYRLLADGLDQVEKTLREEDIHGEYNDLYFNLTRKLYDIVGEEKGCLLHVGRSRNDMECACNRMQIRRELLDLLEQLSEVMETLLDVAEQNVDTVIAFFTFGQPAQPGTYAHYLMLAFDLFARDCTRLRAAYQNTNRSPMGAAAGIGTSFPLDPKLVSELLGFDAVIENSLDAVSSPDYLLEVEADTAIMASNLSKIAQDLFHWASQEYHILDCDGAIATTSSIMPQKKNPTCFERMRAQSGRAAGMLAEAMALSRNTTLFPSMEATIDMFYVFGFAMEETRKALGLLQVGLRHSQIRRDVARTFARDSFTGATAMAEYLSQTYQIPFAETHRILHGMIDRLTAEKGGARIRDLTGALLAEVTGELLDKPIVMTDVEVQHLLEPEFCLEQKLTGGTPKYRDTIQLIEKNRAVLHDLRAWLKETEGRIQSAYAQVRQGL